MDYRVFGFKVILVYVVVGGVNVDIRFFLYKGSSGLLNFNFVEEGINNVFLFGVNFIFDGIFFEFFNVDCCF